ncbi:hypothetical protein Tco_0860862, partial [Tanacetum coccineum]
RYGVSVPALHKRPRRKQDLIRHVMYIAMHADFESNCVVPVNDNNLAYAEMEQSYIDEYTKVLELETELSKKKNMVKKVIYNELSDRWMYKLDLLPLSPMLKKSRKVHVDYLKQAKAHAETLRAIVELMTSNN